MKAVIMAGGKGTRLSSLLNDLPKPMIQIAGKPVLEHQVENLVDNGITEIMLVIGYLGEVIEKYFGDGSNWGATVNYFKETEPLGTAGSLYFIRDWLDEDFVLLFGDVFIDIDFKRMKEFHKQNSALATLFAHPNSHPYDSDLLVTDQEDHVVEWLYKNTEREKYYKNLTNAGVYMFSPRILEYVKAGSKLDLEKDVLVNAMESGEVFAYISTEYVKDIGTPDRYRKVCEDFENGICDARNLKYKQKCIFLDRDGTINKYVGLLTDEKQMEMEQTVPEAIKKINQSKYLVIVITNQPVIARGDCTIERLDEIHNKMYTLLGEAGCYVDDLYFCPHHPDSGYIGEVKELKIKCNCRKPNIGMLEQASKDHNIDLSQSWIIGDTTMDIQTGKNAGMKTMLVLTGEAGKDGKYFVEPDCKKDTLEECINYILDGELF